MENSELRSRILVDFENLIASSCTAQKVPHKMEQLHIALLKHHYNAANVSLDYHRRRVEMDIVMDDNSYDPNKVNMSIPTLHTNLWFRNLHDFLKSCIGNDTKSLAFYAKLLNLNQSNKISLVV